MFWCGPTFTPAPVPRRFQFLQLARPLKSGAGRHALEVEPGFQGPHIARGVDDAGRPGRRDIAPGRIQAHRSKLVGRARCLGLTDQAARVAFADLTADCVRGCSTLVGAFRARFSLAVTVSGPPSFGQVKCRCRSGSHRPPQPEASSRLRRNARRPPLADQVGGDMRRSVPARSVPANATSSRLRQHSEAACCRAHRPRED